MKAIDCVWVAADGGGQSGSQKQVPKRLYSALKNIVMFLKLLYLIIMLLYLGLKSAHERNILSSGDV